MSRSHLARGNFGSQVARRARKWAFHVSIMCLAALRRWLCGGTIWNWILYFSNAFFELVRALDVKDMECGCGAIGVELRM
jgi:hypothetical protein